MLVVGIDEAGYGPLLGPLVVAGCAFRVADGAGEDEASAGGEGFAPRFGRALEGVGVTVDDSKRLFSGRRDLRALELPVLAFAGTLGAVPSCLDDLLAATCAEPGERRGVPWYAGDPDAFPRRAGAAETAEASARIAEALRREGIEFAGFAADVLPEARFNLAVRDANKADALFDRAASVFERLTARRREGEPVRAVFDRHGGRRFYLPLLRRRFPEAFAWAAGEGRTRSDYLLRGPGRDDAVSFVVGADGLHPQVALASMLAKYLRELHMDLFNGYFAPLCPGVAPTAGYAEDGRRWLDESRRAREAAGIPDDVLVRAR